MEKSSFIHSIIQYYSENENERQTDRHIDTHLKIHFFFIINIPEK